MEAIKNSVQALAESRSVTNYLQSGGSHQVLALTEEPGRFDPLEAWERFLADSILMPHMILYAATMVELKKEELELEGLHGKLPWGAALIDPPGPFDSLAAWEEFLAGMQTMADCVLKREVVLRAKQEIAKKKREGAEA